MTTKFIQKSLKNLEVSSRILDTLSSYLLCIMLPSHRHNPSFASKVSKKGISLFSHFLKNYKTPSQDLLNRAARRKIKQAAKHKAPLFSSSPWEAAIIIDSTIHSRYSRKAENTHKFCRDGKWFQGHQWTNICIFIGGSLIPLPPIPFYTRTECERRGISYQTEIHKLISWFQFLNVEELFSVPIDRSKIVVLADTGYDSNDLYKSILKKGFNFVVSARHSRAFWRGSKRGNLLEKINRARQPWKTARIQACSRKNKWISYSIKHLRGSLNRWREKELSFVCSVRLGEPKKKVLCCSQIDVSARQILQVYQIRWKIEIFHREVKTYLGLEDFGGHRFDRICTHVHLVYLAYLLLEDDTGALDSSTYSKQKFFESRVLKQEYTDLVQMCTRIDGVKQIKNHCLQAIEKIERRDLLRTA